MTRRPGVGKRRRAERAAPDYAMDQLKGFLRRLTVAVVAVAGEAGCGNVAFAPKSG